MKKERAITSSLQIDRLKPMMTYAGIVYYPLSNSGLSAQLLNSGRIEVSDSSIGLVRPFSHAIVDDSESRVCRETIGATVPQSKELPHEALAA